MEVSEGNAGLVRRLFETMNADPAGVVRLCDPEIEFVNPNDAVEPGTRRGLEEMQLVAATLQETFESWQHEIVRVAEAGDRAAAEILFRAKGKGSGVEAEQTEGHLFTVRDGRILRWEWSRDPDAAFRELGR